MVGAGSCASVVGRWLLHSSLFTQKHQLQRPYNQPPSCFCLYSPLLPLRQLRHTLQPVFLPTSSSISPHISLTHNRGYDSTLLPFPSHTQPAKLSYPFRTSSSSSLSSSPPSWPSFARVSFNEAKRFRLVPHQISYYASSG